MFEIRWHGRGGQGAVTASQILAAAALLDGKYVQAFPEFGPERAGAPVRAFTRISDEPINIHSQIYTPDVVVVIDPTLLKTVNVTEGLIKGGKLIVNTDKTPEEIKKEVNVQDTEVYTVNATRIALDIVGRALFNTPMLGALIKATGVASLDSVIKETRSRFPGPMGDKNVEMIKRAFEGVRKA
ncbi:pyruvate ferredoxin oxidoreductase subunit gamma [Candidatus Bathyarchaeota archaeon]|nr:pyruvate ferredoxin oxidoreductase subunit gamma [Candidatus Bathyarchaeota archaeon]